MRYAKLVGRVAGHRGGRCRVARGADTKPAEELARLKKDMEKA